MTGNKLVATRRQFAFDDVQVGSANATGTHPQQNVSGDELRTWDVDDLKRTFQNVLRRIQDGGFHRMLQSSNSIVPRSDVVKRVVRCFGLQIKRRGTDSRCVAQRLRPYSDSS